MAGSHESTLRSDARLQTARLRAARLSSPCPSCRWRFPESGARRPERGKRLYPSVRPTKRTGKRHAVTPRRRRRRRQEALLQVGRGGRRKGFALRWVSHSGGTGELGDSCGSLQYPRVCGGRTPCRRRGQPQGSCRRRWKGRWARAGRQAGSWGAPLGFPRFPPPPLPRSVCAGAQTPGSLSCRRDTPVMAPDASPPEPGGLAGRAPGENCA